MKNKILEALVFFLEQLKIFPIFAHFLDEKVLVFFLKLSPLEEFSTLGNYLNCIIRRKELFFLGHNFWYHLINGSQRQARTVGSILAICCSGQTVPCSWEISRISPASPWKTLSIPPFLLGLTQARQESIFRCYTLVYILWI